MNKKKGKKISKINLFLIVILVIIVLVGVSGCSIFVYKNFVQKNACLTEKKCNESECSCTDEGESYQEGYNAYKFLTEFDGEEFHTLKSEDGFPIVVAIIDGKTSNYLYCDGYGETSSGEKIVAPYTRETGCIYTEEFCEKFNASDTTLYDLADMSHVCK